METQWRLPGGILRILQIVYIYWFSNSTEEFISMSTYHFLNGKHQDIPCGIVWNLKSLEMAGISILEYRLNKLCTCMAQDIVHLL